MSALPLWLASQSPRRRQLLRRLRRPFRVVRSTYRETFRRAESPARNAMRNARGKARRARVPRGARGVVLGADTFLYFRGRLIGKPKTLRQARRMLDTLNGRRHWVYTGVCLRDLGTGCERLGWARSRVIFRRVPGPTLDALLAEISPLDKAGGYAVQKDRGRLIARVEGSWTNVMGLPLELLRRELRLFLGRGARRA